MPELPTHVGYIVDGNRRWATARGKTAFAGHRAGYEKLIAIALDTLARGVPYVSAYVFSTENWKRSEAEVGWLMKLLLRVLKNDAHFFIDNKIRVYVAGSRDRLSKPILRAIDDIETRSASLGSGGTLVLCLNYGGQLEIIDAIKKITSQKVAVEDITTELIEKSLYAPDVPACDLVVRTSGEQRLSNFMLWRSAYSELLFIDTLWPDMTKQDVTSILKEYTRRKRRFGG